MFIYNGLCQLEKRIGGGGFGCRKRDRDDAGELCIWEIKNIYLTIIPVSSPSYSLLRSLPLFTFAPLTGSIHLSR